MRAFPQLSLWRKYWDIPMNLPIWNMPAQSRALNRDLSELVSCLMICKWNCYCFFASHFWAPLFLTVGCLCQTIKVENVFKLVRGFIDINEREVRSKLMTVVFHVGRENKVLKGSLFLRYMILPQNNVFLLLLCSGFQVSTFICCSCFCCM